MLKIVLWSILAVWIGIAFVILGALVVTLFTAAARTARDRLGKKGKVYCPDHGKDLAVVGVPSAFGTAPYDELLRCEAFERGEPRCEKKCLKEERNQVR